MKNKFFRNNVSIASFSTLVLASVAPQSGPVCKGAEVSGQHTSGGSRISGHIDLNPLGPAVPRMFMGYSIEWGLIGRMLRKEHGRFATTARSIRELEEFTGPMLLRIGGDSENEAAFDLPVVHPRPKFVHIDIRVKTLRRMRALAHLTGCQYVLGLNLSVNNPALAVQLVKAAEKYIGRRHIADFEIGNEPNLLGGLGHRTWWAHNNYRMYMRRWTRYYHAIAPYLGKTIKIEGPAFSGEGWFTHLPSYLRTEHSRLGIISLHQYPMGAWIKNPRSLKFASIAHLLGPRASCDLFSNEMRRIVRLAAPYHLPVRFGEMNSVSGGGRQGVSNTFASTLWAANTLLGIAGAGGAGVNLHMSQGIDRFPGWYGPLRIGPGGHLHIMPVFDGMLAAADVVQHGGRPVEVDLHTRLNISAFAFVTPDHMLRVAIVNRTPSSHVFVDLHFPSDIQLVRCYHIDAPSLGSSGAITITGFRTSGPANGRMMHTHLSLQHTANSIDELFSPASSIVIEDLHI